MAQRRQSRAIPRASRWRVQRQVEEPEAAPTEEATHEDAASPFQRRLEAAERDVRALLALRSTNVVAQVAENARFTLGE
ncbi:uncharacterized protein A4U43_C02F17890 [Asparagus officinalis]|uniref:Uncharacterized protein n=1 Tax=Asparagus officinalis TaxID=4686 RepID=A0A5P1FJ02_ASPOF|nr:uncharacterized protein A4U43_C02F17890 [Asparagus officinalis]